MAGHSRWYISSHSPVGRNAAQSCRAVDSGRATHQEVPVRAARTPPSELPDSLGLRLVRWATRRPPSSRRANRDGWRRSAVPEPHSSGCWNFHRHQQGVTRFDAHAPATHLGDEFALLRCRATHPVRDAREEGRRDRGDGPPAQIRRWQAAARSRRNERPRCRTSRRRGRALIGAVGFAGEAGPDEYRLPRRPLRRFLQCAKRPTALSGPDGTRRPQLRHSRQESFCAA